MNTLPEIVQELRELLAKASPDFAVELHAYETPRAAGEGPIESISHALGSTSAPIHSQAIDPTQVLRQLHDSFASEPTFLIGVTQEQAQSNAMNRLVRQLRRQVSQYLRSAVAVHEFWLLETKELYERKKYIWEFAFVIQQLNSATVLIGHSQAAKQNGGPNAGA